MNRKELLNPHFKENGLFQKDYEDKEKTNSFFSEKDESSENSYFFEKERKIEYEQNSIDEENCNKKDLRIRKTNDMQPSFLNRKKANKKNIKNESSIQYERKNNFKKKLNGQIPNSNTLSEINIFYNELEKLISNFSFTEVVSIILKIINGIPKDYKDNNKLFNKINKITEKIENQNCLTLICLSILSSKISFNNTNNNDSKIENKEKRKNKEKTKKRKSSDKMKSSSISNGNKNYDRRNIKENGNNQVKEEKLEAQRLEFIKGFRCYETKLEFGKHYFNRGDEIFGFRPKTKKLVNTVTCYCLRREIENCEAKCKLKVNSNKVLFIGHHNHESGISTFYFYKKYYFLKDKEWTHIQIIRKNGKKKIFLQS